MKDLVVENYNEMFKKLRQMIANTNCVHVDEYNNILLSFCHSKVDHRGKSSVDESGWTSF